MFKTSVGEEAAKRYGSSSTKIVRLRLRNTAKNDTMVQFVYKEYCFTNVNNGKRCKKGHTENSKSKKTKFIRKEYRYQVSCIVVSIS
jgi:hypothetical protein